MDSKRVLLIGPGFIGEAILQLLIQNAYQVSILVRRESAPVRLDVKSVFASLDESEVIEETVVSRDSIIHTASSRHLASVEAVFAGIRRRAGGGKDTIYIHTSGATHLADDSAGFFRGDKIYDDNRPHDIDGFPNTESRVVDLAILRHRDALGAGTKIAIVTPPLVYGVGPVTGRLSIQLPTLVRYALKHGYAGQIGQGLSVWNHIHVKDLARGYMTILKWMESTPSEYVNSNPWWFCENGEEISWNQCAAAIGQAVHHAGRINNSLPKTIPPENYSDLFGTYTETALGSNSRNRATRLRTLGWEPEEKTSLASLIEDEIPVILEDEPVVDKFQRFDRNS